MPTRFADYENAYRRIARLERDAGVVQVTLTDDGGPFVLTHEVHHRLGSLFDDLQADPEVRAIILTGTGDQFCTTARIDDPSDFTTARGLAGQFDDGRRMARSLLDLEVPVVAAVNGPAHVHADLMVASDIVLATPDTTFQDFHVPGGLPVGGIAPVVWTEVLGPIRGAYFLMTGQVLSADEAYRLGVVNEVVPRDRLLARAWELGRGIASMPALASRYARIALGQRLKERFEREAPGGYALIALGALVAAEARAPASA